MSNRTSLMFFHDFLQNSFNSWSTFLWQQVCNSFKNVIQPWNHQFFNLPLKVLELYAKGNNWMFDRKWNSSSVLILPGKLFSIRYTRAGLGYQILWHSIVYAKYLPIVKSEKVVFWEVHILTNFIFIFQVSNFWNSQIFFSAHILEPEPSLMRCSKFDWPRKSTIVHEECVAVHT